MHPAKRNDRDYGLIFLENNAQPYKDHAQYLSKELENHDPEVSLAVRVRGLSSAPLNDEEEEVDEFLSSLGFEFVDVCSNTPAGNHDGAHVLSDGKSNIDSFSFSRRLSLSRSQ